MTDINLQTITPDTTLPKTGFLFGADSQASGSPSVYTVQSVATTLLGSTTLTGATITTSQPVIDAAQTWNAGGVTFTGLKFNAATGSNAGSAAASLLMDLQLEGASKFNVRKNGVVNVEEFIVSRSGMYTANAAVAVGYTAGEIAARFTGRIGFTSTSDATIALDTIITRRDTANLRFGAADAAAPVAQKLSV